MEHLEHLELTGALGVHEACDKGTNHKKGVWRTWKMFGVLGSDMEQQGDLFEPYDELLGQEVCCCAKMVMLLQPISS